jgi:membrane protein
MAAAFENRTFGTAKAAAYSALLAFFPVLTSAAAILVQVKADFVSKTVTEFLFEVVPPGADELVRYQFTVRGQRPVLLLIVAAALATLAASGVVGSLIEGFHDAYRMTKGRPFFQNMAVSILLVVLATLPLLVASCLILFGGWIDRFLMRAVSVEPMLTPVATLWHLAAEASRMAVAFGAAVAVMMMLYYYGPHRRQRWRWVWRGAVLATFLWLVATQAFGWYVRHLANYNVLYGSVATSIALLVWMYLMSLIALLGCEFNAEYERTVRPRSPL